MEMSDFSAVISQYLADHLVAQQYTAAYNGVLRD